MQEYSRADLSRLFGLPPALIRRLGQAGCITQGAGRGKIRYSFQDLLVLRVAGSLKAARISSPRIVAALTRIRDDLPPGRVLATVTVAASGKDLSVHDGMHEWEASGQYALPLKISARQGQVAHFADADRTSTALRADEHYRRGHELEDNSAIAARAEYRQALRIDENHPEARINLGRLLHLDGQLEEAEALYRQAAMPSAVLSFNLAVLLEDLDRTDEAIAAYHDALARDPMLHDAHFNLSRLYEISRRPREALRHLLAYRRHVSHYGE